MSTDCVLDRAAVGLPRLEEPAPAGAAAPDRRRVRGAAAARGDAGGDATSSKSPRKDEPALDYVKRIARTKASVGWHRMMQRAAGAAAGAGRRHRSRHRRRGAWQARRTPPRGRACSRDCPARTHEVITAVAVRWHAQLVLAVSTSRVTLRALAPTTRSNATSPPANPSTRPAATRSRAAPRRSSSISKAAIRA